MFPFVPPESPASLAPFVFIDWSERDGVVLACRSRGCMCCWDLQIVTYIPRQDMKGERTVDPAWNGEIKVARSSGRLQRQL